MVGHACITGDSYFIFCTIANLGSAGEEVVGTITAVTAFLGVVIGVSSHNYNK